LRLRQIKLRRMGRAQNGAIEGAAMKTYDDSMAGRFRALLQERERQLRASLGHAGDAGASAEHEVMDFKDIATQETMAAVDDVQAGHASAELRQVLAALARLDSHDYGACERCGEAIDLKRLEALPFTPLCIACQTLQEHERTPSARR
jgi:DnaK suppressor protein